MLFGLIKRNQAAGSGKCVLNEHTASAFQWTSHFNHLRLALELDLSIWRPIFLYIYSGRVQDGDVVGGMGCEFPSR